MVAGRDYIREGITGAEGVVVATFGRIERYQRKNGNDVVTTMRKDLATFSMSLKNCTNEAFG